MKNKFIVAIVGLLVLSLALVGCGTQQTGLIRVESGVVDKDYVGIVCPEIPREYKITEESKLGMIVVTIKCGVQKEIPGDPGEGESDEAKPKI